MRLSCSAFITSTIRTTRRRVTRGDVKSFAGKALGRVHRLAVRASYTDKEFRRALQDLMNRGAVLVVAQTRPAAFMAFHTLKIEQLPADAPLAAASWFFDSDDKQVGFKLGRYGRMIRKPMLYLTADQMPFVARKAIAP